MGKLIDVAGTIGTIYLGLPRKDTVKEAINPNGWCISRKRSWRFHDLYNKILAQLIPDAARGTDIVLWKHGEDDFKDVFLSTATWEQI